MLLKVNNIQVQYEGAEALKGISFEIAEGGLICLIGANGAGKTTTLNTIVGVKALASGEIWFQEKRIDQDSPLERVQAGISMVPEGRRVFQQLTILENLNMGAYLRKDKEGVKQDREWVYQLFPVLKERSRQSGGTLSGGEQQMLAIGRGLMAHPKLMMLDEPTLGLSPLMCDVVAEMILEINRRGIAVLLAEQSAQVSLSISQNAYILEVGEIILQGDASELMDNEMVKNAYLGT